MTLRKPFLICSLILIAIVLLSLIPWVRGRKADPDFLLQGANAYDDFTQAGRMLLGTPSQSTNTDEFVVRNKPALDRFRAGLQRRFEAPRETYDLKSFSSLVMPNLTGLRSLALAVKSESETLEAAGRYREAALIDVEIVHFGQKVQAGPLVFLLVGMAIEEIGRKGLENIETKLTASERREIAATLKNFQRERISFDQVKLRERYFGRRSSPTPIHYMIGQRFIRSAIETARIKHERMIKAAEKLIETLETAPEPKSGPTISITRPQLQFAA